MRVKKIIGMVLLISYNVHGMLTVKPLSKKCCGKISRVIKSDSAALSLKKYIEEINKSISIENYEHNKHDFFSRINFDIIPQLMAYLDHLSNIQFIRSSKHLYETYTSRNSEGGVNPLDCLFTQHPFPFEPHTRAMFHYAACNKKQAEMLLDIQDDSDSKEKLLKKFFINTSDREAVMDFYQQIFSYDQIFHMLYKPELLQKMLKIGISPNIKDEKGNTLLINALYRRKVAKLLNILLQDPRIDVNAKDKDGDTALMRALWRDNAVELLNTLLQDPRIDVNAKNKDGDTALMKAVWQDNAVELLNILLQDPRIEVNAKNKDGNTVFKRACWQKDPLVALTLLRDSRVNEPVNSFFYWWEYRDLYKKDPEIMKLLSEKTSFFTKIKVPGMILACLTLVTNCAVKFSI